MRHFVVGVVAFVAVLLLSLGPVVLVPLAGLLLGLCAVTAGAMPSGPGTPGAPSSGVGDEPGPLRP
ncbi:hypothetical protein EDF64_10699 [Curtobacterium flaccumfaciens]|uniref:Uncharacterized protein n=1 Tax=Curtobacterium flaccumfaciens TaxID=2035 RepID=A0A4R6DGT1_9MICO|nr:hypothetical protein EDF64_10699 [Curtobacterium flaccumfaciens]